MGEEERGGRRSRRSLGLSGSHLEEGSKCRSAGDRLDPGNKGPARETVSEPGLFLKIDYIWAKECLHSGIIS